MMLIALRQVPVMSFGVTRRAASIVGHMPQEMEPFDGWWSTNPLLRNVGCSYAGPLLNMLQQAWRIAPQVNAAGNQRRPPAI